MVTLHRALAAGFAAVLDPLARLPPLVSLTLISAVSGAGLLLAFRTTSNPTAIRAAKSRAQAQLLAVRLYRDDLVVAFRAQAALLQAVGVYLGHMLLPFLVLLVPFGLLFAQLDARYAVRALHPGERAIVKVLRERAASDRWRLESSDGVAIDSVPVRIPARGEIDWRVRADTPGRHTLAVVDGDRRIEKEIRVAADDRGAAPRRSVARIDAYVFAPSEALIDPGTGITSVEVLYPPLRLQLLGWTLPWIVVFLLASAATALLLRRWAGVEF